MGDNIHTSNSIKFTPKPLSVLFANWKPLKNELNNLESSYTSCDDSDNSSYIANTVKAELDEQNKKEVSTTKHSVVETKEDKSLTVERVIQKCNKENNIKSSLSNNRTYPNKDSHGSESVNVWKHPSSEVKKRNVLMPHDANIGVVLSEYRKPEEVKFPASNHKIKVTTPVIKAGIRKFTPSSTKKSQKKTPLKQSNVQTKESVRCLFPENKEAIKNPLHAQAVVDTPINKISSAPTYAATPSHPQGVVGNNSKLQFRTSNIKGKNYMYIKELGVGGSSKVYKVLEVGTSLEYAVKCVDLSTDKELVQGYLNEVRLLRQLQNSDRVIRLYDYEYNHQKKFLRVVLEVGETDLSSFLKARGAGLPPALVLHYWEEMLHAVNYIHQHGVIHADLKPANFLLVCGRLKLIDFGIASAISSDATSVVRSQTTGTFSYISPEALGGGTGSAIKISFKSDVWSLGCILYSMVYGHTPFSHFNNLGKLAAILNPNHRIEYPSVHHLPPSVIAALKWCLTHNVRGRPEVRQLLAIPYLSGARAALPAPLLLKLKPHLSPSEVDLLQRAYIDC